MRNRSNRSDSPGLIALVEVLPDNHIGFVLHLPSFYIKNSPIDSRNYSISSACPFALGWNYSPLLIGGVVGLTHAALSPWLRARNLKSSTRCTVKNAESTLTIRYESPLLIFLPMVLPDNELVPLVGVVAGVQ